MLEKDNQSKIIKEIKAYGGRAINGTFSTRGEADLQCGFPYNKRLYDLAIETKSEPNYYRVMEALEEEEGLYKIVDIKKLKKHEPIQVAKINQVRKLGGLALFAFNFDQVKKYCLKELSNE